MRDGQESVPSGNSGWPPAPVPCLTADVFPPQLPSTLGSNGNRPPATPIPLECEADQLTPA